MRRTIPELARIAGVSKQAMNYYFGLDGAPKPADIRKKVRQLIRVYDEKTAMEWYYKYKNRG